MRTKDDVEADLETCKNKLEVAASLCWPVNVEYWHMKIAELEKEKLEME